jgi:hypothetical protein
MPDQVHDGNGHNPLAHHYAAIIDASHAAAGALRGGGAPSREVAHALTDVALAVNAATEALGTDGGVPRALHDWARQLRQLAVPFASEVEVGRDRGQALLALDVVATTARRLLDRP